MSDWCKDCSRKIHSDMYEEYCYQCWNVVMGAKE